MFTEHSLAEMTRQRRFTAFWPTTKTRNDHDTRKLRSDPVFKLVAGCCRIGGRDLGEPAHPVAL